MNDESLVATLRQKIDKKHADALRALETLAAYLVEDEVLVIPKHPAPRTRPATNHPKGQARRKTRVDRVMAVLTSEPKSIDIIQRESGEDDIAAVRAVLYSKFVQPRIIREKVGDRVFVRLRSPESTAANGEEVSAASLVRNLMAAHPDGMTAAEVHAAVGRQVESIGSDRRAIGAALYNMKKRGKLMQVANGKYYPITKDD